jgi:hypothetical protein
MRAAYASRADYAKNAYEATMASLAIESQRVTQAGNMIVMKPTNHLVIFLGQNQDPSTSIIFDLVNRNSFGEKL